MINYNALFVWGTYQDWFDDPISNASIMITCFDLAIKLSTPEQSLMHFALQVFMMQCLLAPFINIKTMIITTLLVYHICTIYYKFFGNYHWIYPEKMMVKVQKHFTNNIVNRSFDNSLIKPPKCS